MHADSASKSLYQNFFCSRGKKYYISRQQWIQTGSVHQSQNEDNFLTPSLGLEFLDEAEKEKNNGKGDSASAPSRFASLSEGEIQQILTERHSGKTKQMTNWSVSTFKGKPGDFSL